MTYVFFWIGLSISVGMLAGKRGRGSGNWFVLSLLISPLLAGIFLLIADDLSRNDTSSKTHAKCPACAELILREASKCKHCGTTVTPIRYDPSKDINPAATKEVAVGTALLIGLCILFYFAFR